MSTIPDLRRRAYILANKSINNLNSLNNLIFTDNAPTPIENIEEDISNISLDYIQKGIDVVNQYLPDISVKFSFVNKVSLKHKECLDAFNSSK